MTAGIQDFDFSVDLLQALLWQYNESANLQGLLELKQSWYDENQQEFWSDWFTNVFDLQTADAFGLTIWAIILNVPIFVSVTPIAGKVGFAFGPLHKNFTHGNFNVPRSGAQTLTVDQARTVLRMRFFQITSRGTVPEINNFLSILFGAGKAHVIDGYDMTMKYIFNFAVPSALQYIFAHYDILPRPAGVSSSYQVIVNEPFGFDSHNENFGNGNFAE